MNPFEISRLGFSTRRDDDVMEPECVTAFAMVFSGLLINVVGYVSMITALAPALGGGAWYAIAVLSPLIIVGIFEVVVPVFTSDPPARVALLCTVIAPGFIVIWVPWVALWLVWRTLTAVPVMRARAAWGDYWRARRKALPRAVARHHSSES